MSEVIRSVEHNTATTRSTAGIVIDLQKAFDTIWHKDLLHKLYMLGIEVMLSKSHSFICEKQYPELQVKTCCLEGVYRI